MEQSEKKQMTDAERDALELNKKTVDAVRRQVPLVTIDARHIPCLEATRRFLAYNSESGTGKLFSALRTLERAGLVNVVEMCPEIPADELAAAIEREKERAEQLKQREQLRKLQTL